MKRIYAVIMVLILALSCFPLEVFSTENAYTFVISASSNDVDEGETFTVSMSISGNVYNDFSAVIQYGTNNRDALALLDCTIPYIDRREEHKVYLQVHGDELFESGETAAVLTFGVKDISSDVSPNIRIVSAKADISDNAITENAKEAAKGEQLSIGCHALPNNKTVYVDVNLSAEPEGAGAVYAATGQNSSDRITNGKVVRGSNYNLYGIANEGYEFRGWRFYEGDEIETTSNEYPYTFNYDLKATAVFSPVVYEGDLDSVRVQLYGYRKEALPVAGYEAGLAGLPIPTNVAEYHLYKGDSTSDSDEIALYGTLFYMPENTDKLTLTCQYRSGHETVEMHRVMDVQTADVYSAERMILPAVTTIASNYITHASLDIVSSVSHIDPVTGALNLYAAGGYSGGAVSSRPDSANTWAVEQISGSGTWSNAYPAKASINGDGQDQLIWVYSGPPVLVYRLNKDNWTEMTDLEEALGPFVGDKTDVKIIPLSGDELFVVVGKNIFVYDGSELTQIPRSYSGRVSCWRIDDYRILVNTGDGNINDPIEIFDSRDGSFTALDAKGRVIGCDFVNGSTENDGVIFVKRGSSYYMYGLENSESDTVDLSSLSYYGSTNALNRATDGYIYAVVPIHPNAGSWIGMFVEGSVNYIWRTNDLGQNWELVSSGNIYDTAAAAALDGNDDTPATPDPTYYSDEFNAITNPSKGITLITGNYGAVCAIFGTTTITFDSQGGSEVEPITQTIRSYVTAPESPVNGDKIFGGWYLDPECTDDRIYTFNLMPGKDITLYAKWSEDTEALGNAREAAKEALSTAYDSYDSNEYTEDGWKALTREYNNGIKAIDEAESYDAIQEALQTAKDRMAAVEKAGSITVAVTVETFTVNGEYVIEPILVEADSYEKASVVITDLLKATYPDVDEPYRIGGTVQNNFYLRSVWDPDFGPDPVKGYVQNYAGFLSELDCGEQSGWMYCVNGTFPGVGASGWSLKNGDVMRWQYTCSGLGSDIGADNSAWGSSSGVKVADKDALIWRVAEINRDKEAFFAEKDTNEDAYNNAMEVLKDITASQEAVDEALVALGGEALSPEEKLEKAKEAALDALDAYDPADYREAERALLEQYVEEGKAAIEAAETVEEVNAALSEALANISTLITDSEYDAIEEASNADIDKIYADTADVIDNAVPTPGSIGGEWAVIGLVRGDNEAGDEWIQGYYANAINYIDEKTAEVNDGDKLNKSRSTENSRMILGLTAIGKDPRNVGGHDLTQPLADLDYLLIQGINGPIWALIAFDSHDYDIPQVAAGGTQVTRDLLIETILEAQKPDGGWNLSDSADFSDTDMTAMALQALAPYNNPEHPEVQSAVNRALAMLSRTQNSIGGYSSYGVANSESVAQVITALTALGIDPTTDSRFIKNGNTLITNLATYAVEGGGFRHTQDTPLDGMATEQAFYSLTGWYRLKDGKTSLYDMTDVELNTAYQNVEALIDAIGEVSLEDESKIEAARKAYEALSDEQKAMVDPDKVAALEAAEETLSDLKVQRAIELIDAIGEPITLDSERAIGLARNWYNKKLSDDERARVTNYDKLTAAEKALQKIKNETPQGQTKAVTVTIDGVTYEVSQATKDAVEAMQAITDPKDPADALPEDFRDLTPEQEKQILDAYRLYQKLTEDEKLFATNYEDFYENVLLRLGRNYHYDERTDTDARDNEDDILPWHVKLNVSDEKFTDEQLERIREILGEDFNMRDVYRIDFTDVFTGNPYTLKYPIVITFPLPDTESRRTPVFVYVMEDGALKYIDGRVIDGRLVMDTDETGEYALADSSMSWEEILAGGKAQAERDHKRLWMITGASSLIGLIIILFLIWKRRKDEEEEQSASRKTSGK